MKRLITLLTLGVACMLTGCAGLSNFGTNDGYLRYLEVKEAEVTATRQPLLELSLNGAGGVEKIQMFSPRIPVRIEQQKDHPIYAMIGGGLRIFGMVGAIWSTGDAVSTIVEASTGDATNINSFNDNSKNEGSIDLQGEWTTATEETIQTEVVME